MVDEVKCVDCLLCGHDNGWLGSSSKTCQYPLANKFPGVHLCGCHCVFPTATPLIEAKFAVGQRVAFTDECGKRQESEITRIVPIGEYSATELGYAIRGTYGDYVRVAGDITPLIDEQKQEQIQMKVKQEEGTVPFLGCYSAIISP